MLPALLDLLYRLPADACTRSDAFDETMRAVVRFVDEHGDEALDELVATRRALPAAFFALLERFARGDDDNSQELARVWGALVVAKRLFCSTALNQKQTASLMPLFVNVRNRLLSILLRGTSGTANRYAFVFGTVCSLLSELQQRLTMDDCLTLLDKHATDAHVLRCVAEQLEVDNQQSSFCKLFAKLRDSLSSQRSIIRFWSLRILSTAHNDDEDEDDVLKLALQIESTPLTVPAQRDWLNALAKLEKASQKRRSKTDAETRCLRELPIRYVLGVMRMNFTPLWLPCQRLLAVQLGCVGAETFWDVVNDATRRVANDCVSLLRPADADANAICDTEVSLLCAFRHQL